MPLPGILGGFETRQKHFFFTFLEPGKKSENFFSKKNREKLVFFRKKSGFIGNYRDFSEKSAIFRRNFFKQFFHGFFFSTPADNRKIGEKSTDFSDFLFPEPKWFTPFDSLRVARDQFPSATINRFFQILQTWLHFRRNIKIFPKQSAKLQINTKNCRYN